jgi:hypothetical protein
MMLTESIKCFVGVAQRDPGRRGYRDRRHRQRDGVQRCGIGCVRRPLAGEQSRPPPACGQDNRAVGVCRPQPKNCRQRIIVTLGDAHVIERRIMTIGAHRTDVECRDGCSRQAAAHGAGDAGGAP